MRYSDEDLPDWDAEDRDFAVVWRIQPKWVVSRSLKSIGGCQLPVQDILHRGVQAGASCKAGVGRRAAK